MRTAELQPTANTWPTPWRGGVAVDTLSDMVEEPADDELAAVRAVESRVDARSRAVAEAKRRLKAAAGRGEQILEEARERSAQSSAALRRERLAEVAATEEKILRKADEEVEALRRWSDDNRAATAEAFAAIVAPSRPREGS